MAEMKISLYESECGFSSIPTFNYLKDIGIDMSKMDEDCGEVFVSAEMLLSVDEATLDNETEADVIKMIFQIETIPRTDDEPFFSVKLNRDNAVFLKNFLQSYLDCYSETN